MKCEVAKAVERVIGAVGASVEKRCKGRTVTHNNMIRQPTFNSEQWRTLYVCLRTCTLENTAERHLRKKETFVAQEDTYWARQHHPFGLDAYTEKLLFLLITAVELKNDTSTRGCNTFLSSHPQGLGCEITTGSLVTAPLTSHSQPPPDRRKELLLIATGPRINYTLEQVRSKLVPRLSVTGSARTGPKSGVNLFLVSLSQAALEQVQSSLAHRICHIQRWNRSGAALLLYASEIFWSSRTVERKWMLFHSVGRSSIVIRGNTEHEALLTAA
uniref:(California timema) hypothetical protein n=1 Tax=Timema californicum TaxID=61474 RepID=A0A7R9JE53_TIMCA|nr:unnamed protein product [Timema californicum]